jgi:hypothetical protein
MGHSFSHLLFAIAQNEEQGGHHKRTFENMDVFTELTWMYSQRVRVDVRHVPLCSGYLK